MLDQMKALAEEQNMCVLATDAGGKPYCSLMAYTIDEDCEEIYMVTQRATQKYKNMLNNPAVSLLIDSREKKSRSRIQALTVEGTFHRIEDDIKRVKIRNGFLETHPYLADFIHHSDTVFFCVKVKAFLLLNGLDEAYYQML